MAHKLNLQIKRTLLEEHAQLYHEADAKLMINLIEYDGHGCHVMYKLIGDGKAEGDRMYAIGYDNIAGMPVYVVSVDFPSNM